MKMEKENKLKSLGLSFFLHLVVALILSFTIAWRKPYPPPPIFGIELNFGVSDEGDGIAQPEEPIAEEIAKDQESETTEVVKSESQTENEIPNTPIATVVDDTESVFNATEEPDEQKENNDTQSNETLVKDEIETEEIIKAEYTNNDSKTDLEVEKTANINNQGDQKGTVGDKGNETGVLDSRGLYTNNNSTGMDLLMPGWVWEFTPTIPKIPDNENGKIVFEIECDEYGDIVGIVTLERGLSGQAEKLLKNEILRNSLRKNSAGTPPGRSVGKIVFILRTK